MMADLGVDFNVAFEKLAQFESAEDLADFFISYQVKAVPSYSDKCAITVWMEGQTGHSIRTNMNSVRAVTDKPGSPLETVPGTFNSLTEAMADFVKEFDSGKYPDLIDHWE